jgi:hypothetical protein
MKRRLFNLAAGASLALCVAMIVLWFANAPPVRYPALPLQGAVSSVRWFAGTGRRMVFLGLVTLDPSGPAISWDGLGFMYMRRPEQITVSAGRSQPCLLRYVGVPVWFVALAALGMSILFIRPALRLRRLRRAGRCPACGYDLRATPDRCPECGAVPGVAA